MKRTTKTIVKEYDNEGKLIKETETTVEETEDNKFTYVPNVEPTTPINPWTFPIYPSYPIVYTSSDNAKNITVTYKTEA